MIRRLATALAVSFALTSIAAPAMATEFRTAEPQAFSSQDLQQYGLDAATTERALDLQNQGYEIRVLSEEEAAGYQAGITDNQWLLLGILAGVIVIAVAVAD
jgi:Ni/Co efflux regulator RcnB